MALLSAEAKTLRARARLSKKGEGRTARRLRAPAAKTLAKKIRAALRRNAPVKPKTTRILPFSKKLYSKTIKSLRTLNSQANPTLFKPTPSGFYLTVLAARVARRADDVDLKQLYVVRAGRLGKSKAIVALFKKAHKKAEVTYDKVRHHVKKRLRSYVRELDVSKSAAHAY